MQQTCCLVNFSRPGSELGNNHRALHCDGIRGMIGGACLLRGEGVEKSGSCMCDINGTETLSESCSACRIWISYQACRWVAQSGVGCVKVQSHLWPQIMRGRPG